MPTAGGALGRLADEELSTSACRCLRLGAASARVSDDCGTSEPQFFACSPRPPVGSMYSHWRVGLAGWSVEGQRLQAKLESRNRAKSSG